MNRFAVLLISCFLSTSVWALSPQIEADRLLLQAKTSLDAKDYGKAIQSLEKAITLNIKMPETFYFHLGKAYSGAKQWDKAQAAFEKYLDQAGSQGKFYREALEAFNLAESESAKDRAYAEALSSYQLEMEQYKPLYDEYRAQKDKCDYARSDEGRHESCDNWVDHMTGSEQSKQDLRESCYTNAHNGNAEYICSRVPDRPREPKKPSRE